MADNLNNSGIPTHITKQTLQVPYNYLTKFERGWRGGPTNMCFWGCSDEADGYVDGANPKHLAVLVSPDLCFDGSWLGEENEEIVWCYTRADASGAETDTNGAVLWHPVQPVKWYRKLPEWAK